MSEDIKPGLYEHFKGKRYEVVGLARHSETLEPLVVYKALYEGNYPYASLWVRPLAMFKETVTAAGRQVPRFKYLGNENPSAAPLSISVEDGMIVVKVKGEPSQELLRECHDKILPLVQRGGYTRILYDGSEMIAPGVEVPLSQWKLDRELGAVHLRRAILVPDAKLAYLARLAFAEGDYQVFYNDREQAIRWLKEGA